MQVLQSDLTNQQQSCDLVEVAAKRN